MDPRDRDIEDDWPVYHRALEEFHLEEIETRVARLVSLGHTNARIAEELAIPLPTVKWHVRSLFLKFEVSDRHDLADEVQRRVAALRKREARRGSRQGPADLRLVKKRRRRPDPEAGDSGDARSAPDA